MHKAKRQDLEEKIGFIDGQLLRNASETAEKRVLLADETNQSAIFILQLQLQTLMHMHKGLFEAKTRLSAALSPVNLLPDETLSYIFDFVAEQPEWYHMGEKSGLLIIYPPLVAEVCSRWRQVALTTPSLWKLIQFVAHNEYEYAHERLWLKRSNPCLLDVDISDVDTPQTMKTIFNILLPHFDRIEAFHINCRVANIMQKALTLFPTFAPELRYLTLSSNNPRAAQPAIIPFQKTTSILTEGAPKLESASFTNFSVAWHDFPVANLETLSLFKYSGDSCIYWEEFGDYLRAIPRLKHLSLNDVIPRFIPGGSPSHWSPEPIILSTTTTKITLIYRDVNVLIEILKRLVFPGSKNIFINVRDGSPALINLLHERKVFATAETFEVNGLLCPSSSITEEMIKESFGFPNLIQLQINSYLPSPLFDALSHPLHLCFPKLQKLLLYTPSAPRIRSILQFRMESHKAPPLKTLGLPIRQKPPNDDLKWLGENVGKIVVLRSSSDQDLESDEEG